MKISKISSLFIATIIILSSSMFAFSAFTENISEGVLIRYNGNEKVYSIPENVKTINENAFDGCSELEEIYIGQNVECIKSNAFDNCRNLKLICFCDTNAITLGDSIVNKNVMIFINNENESVRKSIAMNGYKWSTFSACNTFGKNVLMLLYGESIEPVTDVIIEKYMPDYIYSADTNRYFYSSGLSSEEINYSKTYNPGLFVKLGVMSEIWNMPDKEDIESGNDGVKNGIKRLLNAMIKLFR